MGEMQEKRNFYTTLFTKKEMEPHSLVSFHCMDRLAFLTFPFFDIFMHDSRRLTAITSVHYETGANRNCLLLHPSYVSIRTGMHPKQHSYDHGR